MKNSFFQMKGFPIISNLNFEISDKFNFSENSLLEVEIKINTEVFSKEGNEANLKLDVEIFPDKTKNNPLYLKVTSISSFIWAEGLDENIVDSLLKVNAPAIMMSYLRPIISNITTYSGQPPLIIPLIDFTNNK